MKASTIIVTFLLLSVSVFAQTAKYRNPVISSEKDYSRHIYIDPTAQEGGNGSIEKPFNSWEDIQIKSNTAYLFKAGTTYEGDIHGVFTNNYIGMYNDGLPPIVRRLEVSSGTNGLTVNRIHIITKGFVWQMVALSEQDNGPKNVTISNCLIKGIDEGEGYPHRNISGKCNGLTLYHNEVCFSMNDGLYLSSYAPNTTIVSNYFHHNNLGGVQATNSAGDGIQIENAHCDNTYIANNYIDRKESNWKFCLIINSLIDLQDNVICEWNTFVSPKRSSAGGTSVRWLGGTNNIYRKNLIDSWAGLPGIDTYNEHANQPEPYGIRDNIEFGPNIHCALCKSGDNLDFATKDEYLQYIADNGLEEYGSDLDIDNFWKSAVIDSSNPCLFTYITVNSTVVNDTNNLGVGYIETETLGANGEVSYNWSNGENNQNIYNLISGVYTLTITDEKSCSKFMRFNVGNEYRQENIDGEKLKIISVVAENNDGNIEDNMLDGDLSTRWSSNIHEVSVIFTLDSISNVNDIAIATYKGNERNSAFEIYTSIDGINWELVKEITTSGTTTELEVFEITSSVAKYIKLVGLGNNSPASKEWTSVTEIEIWGEIDKNENPCMLSEILISGIAVDDTNKKALGYIETEISGQYGDLSFEWSNGEISQNIYKLTEGEYTLVVTDEHSCKASKTFEIKNIIVEVPDPCENTSIQIRAKVVDDTNSLAIGYIATEISGQNGDLSFAWSNDKTSNNIYNLTEGEYTLVVTDELSCKASKTFEIKNIIVEIPDPCENTNIQISAKIIDDTNSLAVGYIETKISGQNGGLVYAWSNEETSENIYNLTEGEYTLVVTDEFSCKGSKTFKINNIIAEIPEPCESTHIEIDAKIAEDTNKLGKGYIETEITGANGAITFLWSNGKTTKNIYNLSEGKYVLVVTDELSCSQIKTFTVNNINIEKPDPCKSTEISIDAKIANDTNKLGVGYIETIITGANGTINYNWSNNKSEANIYNLFEGLYILIVTDELSCTKTKTFQVDNEIVDITDPCESTEIKINGIASNDTNNLSIGFIETTTSGTNGEASYRWSNEETSENIYNLKKGEYTLTVTDEKSCTQTKLFKIKNIIVEEPDPCKSNPIKISAKVVDDINNQGKGFVETSVTGTKGEAIYKWSNGEAGESIYNLTEGEYILVVTDEMQCSKTASFQVNNNTVDPCESTEIIINATITNDTNNLGVGFIEIEIEGANGETTSKWSNGENSNNLYNLTEGSYTLNVTDEFSCTETTIFEISNIVINNNDTINGRKLTIISAEAEDSDGTEKNMLDKNFNTYWTSNKELVNVIFTLDSIYIVNNVRIATHNGDISKNMFQVYTSTDGEDWELVLESFTSGKTTELETFELASSSAKYVKIVSLGNNSQDKPWETSITEFEIWGNTDPNGSTSISIIPSKIYVYPNPINQQFSIKTTMRASAQILTLYGNSIFQKDLLTGVNNISFDFPTNGTYILKIVYENGKVETKELIIDK